MKIKFLGAAGVVTGSKIEVEHFGTKILVDCGLYQGPKELRELNRQPFADAGTYSAVLLTHAHLDHSGYLPKLVRSGFRVAIYCTPPTKDLTEVILRDSAKLQEEDARFADESRHSKHFPAEPLYTTEDVEWTLDFFRTHPLNEWLKLTKDLSFRFVRSGHILGSAFVQISYSENGESKILTFTGDLGSGRSQVIREPEHILETDYLVCESTYGDRCVKALEVKGLAEIINRVVDRGGTIVIPAFAVGRTQELLYIIRDLQIQGLIPKQIPTYLDSPMGSRASDIYLKYRLELKDSFKDDPTEHVFRPHNFRVTESADESMLLCMSNQPKIVISSSGMLQGGRILHHLKTKLPDERNAVIFTGYQASGTKGLLLKNGLRSLRIHHQQIDVEAEIINLDSLSAHADSDEIMTWLKFFTTVPKLTFLNHGEPEARRALKYRIENELNWKVESPNVGDSFNLSASTL